MSLHLNNDQINELLRLATAYGPDEAGNQAPLEDARRHLDNCAGCQTRMRTHEQVIESLASLKPATPGAEGSMCPPDDVWLEIAAGIADQESEDRVNHAAECDHCGPLLRQARDDFADEVTPGEEALIANLDSFAPKRQGALSAKLSSSMVAPKKAIPHLEPRPSRLGVFPSLGRLVATASVMALVVFGTWFAFHLRAAQSPERLIANAYAEKRTLEIRIEGAPYVPLRQERGSDFEQTRMSRPALLKAEAEIATKLQSDPDDVRWLQASGRASLLEDDAPGAEAAITALEKAHRLAPHNASVSVDLASSYILRGQFMQRPEDYGSAIEILGKVLSSHHDDETAQYNYALALEKALLKSQAVEAWKAFLSHFPKSAWAKEAQDHLTNLQQEISQRRQRSEAPLRSVEQLAAVFTSGDAKTLSEIDVHIEEYQDEAVQKWLPQFFSGGAITGTNLAIALEGLAHLLSERHHDQWLQDLLKAKPSFRVGEAVRLLGDSALKIEASQESEAQREAYRAMSLFRTSHVAAGESRAHLVLLLADQFGHRDEPCEMMAQAIRRETTLRRYPWIRVQVQLEDSLCASVTDRQALEADQSAFQMAEADRFPILRLRAISVESALYSALGDTHRAWAAAAEALETFWNGTYPKLRGYNTLIAQDEINFPQNNWFLEAAILKEALPMVEGDPRLTMVAVEEARLGHTLLQTGDFNGATKSYQQTELLLKRSAPGIQREALSAEAELGFAKVDLKRGRLEACADRLERIRPTLLHIPDDLLLLDFYQTSGIAQLRSNHLDRAERDLNAAVRLAEKGLRLVDTDDDRWKWSRQNEPTYRAIVELKLHEDPRQAFLDWEWYKGAALSHRNAASSHESFITKWPLTPEEAAVAIPEIHDGRILVSFIVLPQGYAVWVWNQTTVTAKWVPLDEEELSSLVARFSEHCSDSRSSPLLLRKEGAILYQKIILPIEPWISGRHRLIVEPDGALRSLPIGLLVNSAGEYLGDQFAISISPGMIYLNRSRKWIGISATSKALVLGDPRVSGWMPLPDAELEARAVASSFDHPYLLPEHAGAPMDLKGEIEQAEVFHFSGHSQSSIQSVGLVAGEYEFLDRTYLDAFKRGRNQLVVLSACSSSRGTSGLFDDDDSMVRRLMGARVPEVVASRWTVDSAATELLMTAFYSELLKGKPTSVALQSATQTVRARSEYSHPYYWASFSAFGSS